MGHKASPLRPLGVVTLALLLERPMHPYEMYQLLTLRGQDQSVKVRPGTLYHVVNWLEGAGYVVATGTEREGNRPERTTYAITPEGREALQHSVEHLLTDPQPEYWELTVGMGEAHNLAPETVATLLRERVATLEARCSAGEERLARAASWGLPRRFVLGGEFAVNRLRADIDWLTSVIADVESGVISWDSPVPPKPKEYS